MAKKESKPPAKPTRTEQPAPAEVVAVVASAVPRKPAMSGTPTVRRISERTESASKKARKTLTAVAAASPSTPTPEAKKRGRPAGSKSKSKKTEAVRSPYKKMKFVKTDDDDDSTAASKDTDLYTSCRVAKYFYIDVPSNGNAKPAPAAAKVAPPEDDKKPEEAPANEEENILAAAVAAAEEAVAAASDGNAGTAAEDEEDDENKEEQLYFGTIASCRLIKAKFHVFVEYDDGDSEEMDLVELARCLALYQKNILGDPQYMSLLAGSPRKGDGADEDDK
jgi:hypothetical protein